MTDIAERFAVGAWEFSPEVISVFDEHVLASVPHYNVIQDLVASISDWLLPAGGCFADLGASTGTTTNAVLDAHPERQVTAWLYDNQPDMLAKARKKLLSHGDQIRTVVHDIRSGPYAHEQADLTACLFTLQFLPATARLQVLRLAREHSAASGAILVAEKVRPVDTRWAEIANDSSHDWKAAHGISGAAIRAKASALRGVLRPLPAATLIGMLELAGWRNVEVIFRWHNWLLLGAFATDTEFEVT